MKFTKIIMKWPMFVSLSFLAACASGPTQEQLSNANYGRNVPATECVSVAERVIADSLKDPGSAQFRHSQCFKGFWGSVPILGMGVEFGWIQKGEVNGKNAYGGYVGFRPYQVLIKNGSAIRYCISDEDGICMPSGSNYSPPANMSCGSDSDCGNGQSCRSRKGGGTECR